MNSTAWFFDGSVFRYISRWLLPTVLLFTMKVIGQSNGWYMTKGGQGTAQSWAVDTDSQGNIYWAVNEIPLFSFFYNITLFKLDPNGRQIWQSKAYGKSFNDYAYNLVVKEPYVYVAGRADTSAAPESANALVLAFDSNNGDMKWEYKWDAGIGYEEVDGIVAGNDGIYISGWTQGGAAPMQMDVFVQKLSFDGKRVWSNSWGGSKWETANGQLVLTDSIIYIAGHYNGTGFIGGGDAMLAAFSRTDGHYLWHSTRGGNAGDDAYGLTASPDGSMYLVGPAIIGAGTQLFILKYSKMGDLIWSTQWGGSGGETARAIATDGDSVLYVAATTDSYGAGMNDFVVVKYDSSGTLLNYKTWGGYQADNVAGMVLKDDWMYIAGNSKSFGSKNMDALLLKLNARDMVFPDTVLTAADHNETVSSFALMQNYPNPFSISTTVPFRLDHPEFTRITVFDTQGRERMNRIETHLPAGLHEVRIDASRLTNGVYTCRVTAGRMSRNIPLVVMK